MASSFFPVPSRTLNPIRPINITRDMPQVMRLLNRVFSPTLDAEGRRALNNMSNQPSLLLRLNQLGHKIAPGFVYEDNGSIVGNVSIIPTSIKGRIIIANVAVDEAYRRRGIARMMMDAALDHLVERGINTVMLQVDVDNDGARRLYHDLGFDSMGSTTYWLASPSSWREISVPQSFKVRPMRPSEYRQAYAVDTSNFPLDLNWPDPIDRNTYRGGVMKWMDNFFNGKSSESWVVAEDDELLGVSTIWSEWGRPHRLTCRVNAANRDELLPPLFGKVLRRLKYARRRHVSIEHPMDDDLMNQLLVASNFYAKRNLTTMKLKFTK